MKTALITGITGQDGSYLAELLLKKNYQVVGLVSKDHNIGNQNIQDIEGSLILETGDLLDYSSLENVFKKHQPAEIYNLAGLTYVPGSWEKPTLTLDINLLGLSRLLELTATIVPKSKFYQASSSKIFGNPKSSPQNEQTPINPQDPYSTSKAAGHLLVQNMRNHFDLFACNGILFNHESERRGPQFVTRKITMAAAKIKAGLQKNLELGDLDAKQDWGYAPDYVEAMWLMLQQDQPKDYIVATGQANSVRDACEIAFSHVELNYQDYVKINPEFIRKEKHTAPLGDPSKAKKHLNWEPKVDFKQMIIKMVEYDIELLNLS